MDGDEVQLTWQPVASGADKLIVQRAARANQLQPQPIATLPPSAAGYLAAAICDSVYSVSAVNAAGDELVSDSSYFTLPCAEGGQNE